MKIMSLPAILFLLSKHPLTLTIALLIQSTLIATLTSFWTNSWLGLIMFIIMSGGVLVMFIYIASISSNMMFKPSSKLIFIMFSSFLLMLFIPSLNLFTPSILTNNNLYSPPMHKLFLPQSSLLTIMCMIYLLITLFVIVKVTNYKTGPLRKMN